MESEMSIQVSYIKFMFSKKAIKFDKNFTVDVTLCSM